MFDSGPNLADPQGGLGAPQNREHGFLDEALPGPSLWGTYSRGRFKTMDCGDDLLETHTVISCEKKINQSLD